MKGFFKRIAGKVLDVDDTVLPREQMEILNDLLSKYKFKIKPNSSAQQALKVLKKKHLVDSITISRKDGGMIISSSGNGSQEALTGTALLNYVFSEIPQSEGILVKQGEDWMMLFPHNGKVFMVKAASDMSMVELKALARELENYLKE